ncbi:hypothetical protein GCM10020000_00020 [Streptomyces olivoverticillatus]
MQPVLCCVLPGPGRGSRCVTSVRVRGICDRTALAAAEPVPVVTGAGPAAAISSGGRGDGDVCPFADAAAAAGHGEASGRRSGAYRLVTFGSSFDRTDRPAALVECARIWRHRAVSSPAFVEPP